MSAKRALIVDDSRSARSFLARILEKYEIAVDTAETAEVAIEYLAKARPDVIFMDHMMPGMDGFQAVQLIKNNPATATIPIMMYTSQEGELYLGQARALGAMGVLPKQIKPAEVSTVLHQLRLVPDRRQGRQSAFTPANDVAVEIARAGAPTLLPVAATLAASATATGAAPAAVPSAEAGAAAADAGAGTPVDPTTSAVAPAAPAAPAIDAAALADLRLQIEAAMRTELGDLRRSISASLDLQSERLLADVRASVVELNPPPPAPVVVEPPPPPRAPWVVAVAASLAAAALGVLWWRETQQSTALVAQLVAAGMQPSGQARADRAGAVPPSADVAGSPGEAQAATLGVDAVGDVDAAALAAQPQDKIVQPVPYGEVPLSGERLEALRTLLRELAGNGFRGLVTVSSHPGRFCLAGSAGEGYGPAPDSTPLAGCDLVGNPYDESLTMAQRQPLALVNLIGTLRRESGGALDVELAAGAESQRSVPYPADSPLLTAADWNSVAEANNRVEIRLRPAD
ncbi:MAG: response regulator [Steroidobacteraceae bacterium]